jgi:hypothetical protein
MNATAFLLFLRYNNVDMKPLLLGDVTLTSPIVPLEQQHITAVSAPFRISNQNKDHKNSADNAAQMSHIGFMQTVVCPTPCIGASCISLSFYVVKRTTAKIKWLTKHIHHTNENIITI